MWSVYTINKVTIWETVEHAKESIITSDVIDINSGKKIKCHIRESEGDNSDGLPHEVVYMFPFVINMNGIPWYLASSYIYEKISIEEPFGDGFHNVALDLAAYKTFIDSTPDLEIDTFPINKKKRVTYRYKSFLKQLVLSGELGITTANRRITSVVGFYKWIIDNEIMEFDNPPFKKKDFVISFTDSAGRLHGKKISSTDLSTPVPTSEDPFDGNTIEDEGKLRPLPKEEQHYLLSALKEIDNIELSLIFLVALFTGARLQTVLTIRSYHVQMSLEDDIEVVPLLAGRGTEIDTKNNKKHVMYFPRWLYEKLRIYSYSIQRSCRSDKAHDYAKDYLFLTNRGNPYYVAKADKKAYCESTGKNHFKKGGTVDTFLKKSVLPKIKELHGKSITFHFHDLRATFGLNLAEAQLKLVEQGVITLQEALNHVQEKMGHSDWTTTQRYLDFKYKTKHYVNVTKNYEAYLLELTKEAEMVV